MSRADLQDHSEAIGPILEVMAICDAWEARTITRLQDLLTSAGNENDLAFDNPYELVFVNVPVAAWLDQAFGGSCRRFTPN